MSAGAPAAFNLVDSSGWIEFFTAGANGPVFKPLIEKTEQLLVPTIALFEVHRVLSRPVAALRSSPAFHGAAMDGIAVNAADIQHRYDVNGVGLDQSAWILAARWCVCILAWSMSTI